MDGLDRLRHTQGSARGPEESLAALDEAAKQFEAIFLRMLLRQMRQTVPKTDLFGSNSNEQEIYEEMLDSALADGLAESRGLGIAQVLFDQFRDHVAAGAETFSPAPEQADTSHFLALRDASREINR